MKLLLENWRQYLKEAQSKTLKDYYDVFRGMMKGWQAGGAEGFPKKEYEDLFYVKGDLSPSPLDGNPLKELIGKRVRAAKGSLELRPRQDWMPEGPLDMAGQEATIEDIHIWHGRRGNRGVQTSLILKWNEDIINQLQTWSPGHDGPCRLNFGNLELWCLSIESKNKYGIELI